MYKYYRYRNIVIRTRIDTDPVKMFTIIHHAQGKAIEDIQFNIMEVDEEQYIQYLEGKLAEAYTKMHKYQQEMINMLMFDTVTIVKLNTF